MTQAKCEAVEEVLERCLCRVGHWPDPPNWSHVDWNEEAGQVGLTAAWMAKCIWKSQSGVRLGAFVYERVLSSVRGRYRQEWKFGLRFISEETDAAAERAIRTALGEDCDEAGEEECACRGLRLAIASRSPEEQRLLRAIFWERRTERELEEEFQICARAVNKRKRKLLESLRRQALQFFWQKDLWQKNGDLL